MDTNVDLSKCTTLTDLSDPLTAVIAHLSSDENDILLRSVIPEICKTEECIVGIDEAGRGPVLGPMVYGISYCVKKEDKVLKKLGCADSKTISEAKREEIFSKLCQENSLGWAVDIISPNRISNCMLKRQKHSLNEISHGSAISLIKLLQENGVNVTEVYVDTVGLPEKYEEKLKRIFSGVKITVSKKADSLYPIVSAASICAKVTRDLALKNWHFFENIKNEETDWGSGYPNDDKTRAFLNEVDPVFGFPQFVRFGWSTAENVLESKCVSADWSDDDEESNENGSAKLTAFFKTVLTKHSYFADRYFQSVDKF